MVQAMAEAVSRRWHEPDHGIWEIRDVPRHNLGADVELVLTSHGFYPRGGGEIRARIAPARSLGALELTTRGTMTRGYAEAYVAGLPGRIAQRELEQLFEE